MSVFLENYISIGSVTLKGATTRSLFIYVQEGLPWKQFRKIKAGKTGRGSDRALGRFTWSSREMGRGWLASSWSWENCKRSLPLRFHGPRLFMQTLVVSGGWEEGKENVGGIHRCLWGKSGKSCLMRGKPCVYLFQYLQSWRWGLYILKITSGFKNDHRAQAYSPCLGMGNME